MHENRETSETPTANQQQDGGEGLGRKARMNVPEELDGGLVPMNHSNKSSSRWRRARREGR
jgi:hypothetical protein